MLKQVAVIGLLGLALVASPVSANETSAIAGAVAGGVASTLVCTAAAIYSNDGEGDPEAYDRPGVFLGAGVNLAIEEFSGDVNAKLDVAQFDEGELGLPGEKADKIDFDDSFGVNGEIGYRCHPRFSVEVEVEWVEGFDGDVHKPSFVGKLATTELETIVITTNAKGYLLTGRTQPYVLLGLGIMRMEFNERDKTVVVPPGSDPQSEHESNFAMRFGGGIDYYLTKNLVLGVAVDYVSAFSANVDYLLVGGGLQYRF